MKKLIFVFVLLFGASMLLRAQTTVPVTNTSLSATAKAAFRWQDTLHDFGRIQQSNPVTHRFTFKNSGKAPLILTRVEPSCGCTVAEYSKEAIQPGKKGFIQVTFNAAAIGVFNKSIAVHSNVGEQPFMLGFKGEVITQQPVTAN